MYVKIKEYPYRYKAFSLNVFSEIFIPGLASLEKGDPDVFIQVGDVPSELTDPLNKGVLFQATAKEFLLHVSNQASFLVSRGTHITVEYKNLKVKDDIIPFLLGTVFGVLLHQRRQLPIHGSTVYYKNKCFVFSGNSGAGKSTLAAAFIQRGAKLVADDISLINFTDSVAEVIPAFPGIKIWEDSLKKLGKEPGKYRPLRSELRKYFMPVEEYQEVPVLVYDVFVLNTHNKDTYEWKNIQGVEKFNMLKSNTYFFRGLNKTGILKTHFEMCNMLAKQVTVKLVTRPNTGFDIDKLADLIESIADPK